MIVEALDLESAGMCWSEWCPKIEQGRYVNRLSLLTSKGAET
jgi:hypothetical protein